MDMRLICIDKNSIQMRTIIFLLTVFSINICFSFAQKKTVSDYVILASDTVRTNPEWNIIVDELKNRHYANVIVFKNSPLEVVNKLKIQQPRYVAIVDLPERINRDYVIEVNQLSRIIDDDFYVDFLWGIITGYNAESALRMVKNSVEPLMIESCVSTIKELKSGKWFSSFAYIDDHEIGRAGEKHRGDDSVQIYTIEEMIKLPLDSTLSKRYSKKWNNKPDLLKTFYNFYKNYDPDLIVTASHATEYNLEMPASLGRIKSHEGILYADFPTGKKDLVESSKRRVYLPIGNCLIANIKNTNKSMTPAWINSANTSTIVGYVVPTWHGRSGWGTLKYWLTNPGRYTIAEAFFLNQQDILFQLHQWDMQLTKAYFNYENQRESYLSLSKILGKYPQKDQLGFFYDRDVLVFYGDPKWDVRLSEIEEESDYVVEQEISERRCSIIIKTKSNFNLERMKGNGFKQEHVLDLPFSYFFPKRIKNPHLVPGQNWNAAVSDDFLLIYNANFKPNNKYVIELAFSDE